MTSTRTRSSFFFNSGRNRFFFVCLYISFIDSRKTRFSFVAFLSRQSSIIIGSIDFFDVFASSRSISAFDRHISISFQHWNRVRFSVSFDIGVFFFELFFYRAFFMEDSLISVTIESVSVESSTESTSVFSTFVFFERMISRTSSALIKFKSFVFFFRSNLFVF